MNLRLEWRGVAGEGSTERGADGRTGDSHRHSHEGGASSALHRKLCVLLISSGDVRATS